MISISLSHLDGNQSRFKRSVFLYLANRNPGPGKPTGIGYPQCFAKTSRFGKTNTYTHTLFPKQKENERKIRAATQQTAIWKADTSQQVCSHQQYTSALLPSFVCLSVLATFHPPVSSGFDWVVGRFLQLKLNQAICGIGCRLVSVYQVGR